MDEEAGAAVLQLEVEDRLFDGVIHGSPEEYEEELGTMQDVDIRNGSQSTLLHVAVKLGRPDWVEALLAKGANPTVGDRYQLTAVRVAEEMCDMYPDSEDQRIVCELVRLAAAMRDAIIRPAGNVSVETLGRQSTHFLENPMSVFDKIDSIIASLEKETSSLKVELSAAENMQTSRGCLVVKIEERVKQLTQEWSPLIKSWNDVNDKVNRQIQTTDGDKRFYLQVLQKLDPYYEERVYRNCIDAMMKKTKIMDCNEEKLSLVSGFYHRLYNEGPWTSLLLKYLQYAAGFDVWIDCGASKIDKMKKMCRYHDGSIRGGSNYSYFVDFEEERIYLGALVNENQMEKSVMGHLATSLAQMAVQFAFKNNGRPYNLCNPEQKGSYEDVIQEAKEKMSKKHNLDPLIARSLHHNNCSFTQNVELISAVPRMIGYLGSMEAIYRLRRQLPSLLVFYEDHVMKRISRDLKIRADIHVK